MSISLENEKMVQLRMWAVDAVAHAMSSLTRDVYTDEILEDAGKLVKFVLGES